MKFKKWVSDLLILISFLSVLIASGECESDLLMVIKGFICCIIFSLNYGLLVKYGRI